MHLSLSWSIPVYLSLSRYISDYIVLSQTISYYLGLSRIIWDCLGLSGTIWDYLEIYLTIWEQVKAGETSYCYWKLFPYPFFFHLRFLEDLALLKIINKTKPVNPIAYLTHFLLSPLHPHCYNLYVISVAPVNTLHYT